MASYFPNPSSPPEHGIPTLLLLTDELPEQDAEPWCAESVAFLAKPFTEAALADAVRQVVDSRTSHG